MLEAVLVRLTVAAKSFRSPSRPERIAICSANFAHAIRWADDLIGIWYVAGPCWPRTPRECSSVDAAPMSR